ncbi:PTS sugar transporter subunit IIB [Brenneria corticis]|uniref:PTS sugar transporter subunit IIB n=1 Tax=Brenneria corticis TaxID=2173106 RepID=A0A2U1U137_9GAMM|nr:PTS sugar transporter subunit IIB [Brenneria sp. CFCC 11842]PWC15376.1 PTS sugar transporter subunit IIB [Brenneria sp. CFCC 11842]
MTHITLVCMGGFSTSILVKKMREAAEKDHIAVDIMATSESNFKKVANQTDILLIGPQVSFIEKNMRLAYPTMKIAVIDSLDYGAMNGENVLAAALKL